MSSDKKHPILVILSAKSHVAVLLCRYYRERYFHADRTPFHAPQRSFLVSWRTEVSHKKDNLQMRELYANESGRI